MEKDNEIEDKYTFHILKELKRQNDVSEKIMVVVNKINVEVAGLKVKSGVWGAIGGTIPVVVIVLFLIIKGFSNGTG